MSGCSIRRITALSDLETGSDPALPPPSEEGLEGELLPPEAERVAKRVARVVTERVLEITSHYRGPIPSGEMLDSYNAALGPGGASRVLALTERQSAYRQDLERMMVQSEISIRHRGQTYGFILAMTALIAGTVLIAVGKSAAGLVPIIGGLVTLVGVFVYSQHIARQDGEPRSLPSPPERDRSGEDRPDT
jgi:uncharacterized membrane protein